MMRSINPATTVIALFIANVSNADPVPEKLDIRSNFKVKISAPIPIEYVFTEGSNTPISTSMKDLIFTYPLKPKIQLQCL